MGFKCGNCGIEFQTRKEWLDHIADVHKSYFIEGDERDIAYHDKKLRAKAEAGDNKAKELVEAKEM